MNKVQLICFLAFLVGAVVAFISSGIGIVVLVLSLLVIFISIILERYNDIKKSELS